VCVQSLRMEDAESVISNMFEVSDVLQSVWDVSEESYSCSRMHHVLNVIDNTMGVVVTNWLHKIDRVLERPFLQVLSFCLFVRTTTTTNLCVFRFDQI